MTIHPEQKTSRVLCANAFHFQSNVWALMPLLYCHRAVSRCSALSANPLSGIELFFSVDVLFSFLFLIVLIPCMHLSRSGVSIHDCAPRGYELARGTHSVGIVDADRGEYVRPAWRRGCAERLDAGDGRKLRLVGTRQRDANHEKSVERHSRSPTRITLSKINFNNKRINK